MIQHFRGFMSRCLAALAGAALAFDCPADAAEPAPTPLPVKDIERSGPVNFQADVLPFLRRNCLACHSASDTEGGLVMETPQAILKGGDSGPVVIPGQGEKSLMFRLAAHRVDPVMPPSDNKVDAKNLSAEQLGLLKRWIDEGAKGDVVDIAGPVQWQRLPEGIRPIHALAVAPRGDLVAAGRANQVFIYSVPGKTGVARLVDPGLVNGAATGTEGAADLDIVQSLAFSPDGRWLASGGYRTVKLWQRPVSSQKGRLKGIEPQPQSLAVSADGRWAAVGESGGTVKVFDLQTNAAVRTIAGHAGPATGVAFSPDGSLLVTASQDRSFRLHRVADGREVGAVSSPAPIHAVAFAREGTQIVTAHADAMVRTWNLPGSEAGDVKPTGQLSHSAAVTSLVPLAKGARILSGSEDGKVWVWDLASGNSVRQFTGRDRATAVAASLDGTRGAWIVGGKTEVYDLAAGTRVAECVDDRRAVALWDGAARALALGRLHEAAATKDVQDAKARLKEAEENVKTVADRMAKAVVRLNAKEAAGVQLDKEKAAALERLAKLEKELEAFTAEKSRLTAVVEGANAAQPPQAADDAVRQQQQAQARQSLAKLTDTSAAAAKQVEAARAQLTKINESKAEVEAAKLTIAAEEKDNARNAEAEVKAATEMIATAEAAVERGKAEVARLIAAQAEVVKSNPRTGRPVTTVALSADGQSVSAAGEDGVVRMWNASTGDPLEVFEGQGEGVRLLASSPAGLLAVGVGGSGIVWEPNAEWKLARTIGSADATTHFVDRVTAVNFSSDGLLLASGGGAPSRGGELKIWKVADGTLVTEMKGAHRDVVFDVEFSPDGKLIASCAADRSARIHESATGKLVSLLEGHTHHVLGVSWRADGRLLATSGADRVVKIWNVGSGFMERTIEGFGKDATAVKFQGANDALVTSVGNGTVAIHDTIGRGGPALQAGSDFLHVVRASDDGRVIAAAGDAGIVHVWNDRRQQIGRFTPAAPHRTVAVRQETN